jgi:translation initiation factor IF-2
VVPVTDIAIIVITADDDIMPQTKEQLAMLKQLVFQLYLLSIKLIAKC